RFHIDDTKMKGSHSFISIVSSHALSLKNTTRIRTVTDRTTVTKIFVGSVRSRETSHTVTLYYSRVAAPLRSPYDVNNFSSLKYLRNQNVAANFVIVYIIDSKFTEDRKWTFSCSSTVA